MKLHWIGFASVLTLFAAQASTAFAAQTPSTCAFDARDVWAAKGQGQRNITQLQIEARSTGTACATARLSYVIKAANGRVLFQRTYNANNVAAFQDVTTPTEMSAALRTWIATGENNTLGSFLPAWPTNARQPEQVEPEFDLARGISRRTYFAVKANRISMNCLPDRDDSSFCVIYQNGAIVPFGRQFFP